MPPKPAARASSTDSAAPTNAPTPTPPTASTDAALAATTPAAASKKKAVRKSTTVIVTHGPRGVPLVPVPRWSRFAVSSSNVDITRNVLSRFLAHPAQDVLKVRELAEMRGAQGVPATPEPTRVVVLHPGSRYLRLGFATDVVPKVVPNVIARRVAPNRKDPAPDLPAYRQADDATAAATKRAARAAADEYFHSRMKQANLKTPLNALGMVQSFNGSARPVPVPALNDPFHIEWIRVDPAAASPPYFVGQRALDLDDAARTQYPLYYPFYAKTLNTRDYTSLVEWHHDVAAILRMALQTELGLTATDLPLTRIALAVPDLLDARVVDELLSVLFSSLGVHSVVIAQESTMACTGAGLSLACVVDIGAHATSISLVENGEITDATRVLVGGDDVTAVLYDLMAENRAPLARHWPPGHASLDPDAWGLANLAAPRVRGMVEEIKEKWCTANEAELAVQVVDVHVREPGKVTVKYAMKVYSEVYCAPLCFFFPGLVDVKHKLLALKRHAHLLEPGHAAAVSGKSAGTWCGNAGFYGLPMGHASPWKHPALSHRCSATAQLMFMDDLTAEPKPGTTAGPTEPPALGLRFPTMTPPAASAEGATPESVAASAATDAASDAPAVPAPPTASTPAPDATPTAETPSPIASMTLDDFVTNNVARPLDVAIHHLIQGVRNEERARKLYASILLVGSGAAKIRAFGSRVLEDRLRRTMATAASTLPASPATAAALASAMAVTVTPPPRDLDPGHVMWKGAAVLARVECAGDMALSPGEWRAYGTPTALAVKNGIVLAGAPMSGASAGPSAALVFDPCV
ncbi:actin-like protein arp8 [Allomyces arbusculus]|nr:actin-like protein arp8 [Allomyces arbusculus]